MEVSRFCLPEVEYLMLSCRPHYLPREFSSVVFVAVYIPQTDAGTKTALNELYSAISKQENAHPEAALLVAGDFNAGKLKCATKGGKKPLAHLYSTHRDSYKALACPPFGESDHISILLNPTYKQKFKQEAPVTRSIKKWAGEADAKLQDSFASTDWNMFLDSSDSIEEYTTSVTGFINKYIDDVVPTVTVHTPLGECYSLTTAQRSTPLSYLCIVTLALPTFTYYLNYLD